MSRWKRYGMLGTPVDDRLRARQLLQRAEDRAVAPSRRELLPGDHRVAPAKPVAEHTCCLPHADGREPPIGKQGLPAGRQDASRNRSGGDRRRIWLVAAALICCPQLTDRSEPQAMPELPELPRRAPDPGVIGEKKVCAARWRVVSGHRGPCRCEPVPHPGGERAGDEDMGECGQLTCTAGMRASVTGRIGAVDVTREAADEELAMQQPPRCHALPPVQMGSVHHSPYMGPRYWWACCDSSSSSINSVICSLWHW